jgi:hypothetical protein
MRNSLFKLALLAFFLVADLAMAPAQQRDLSLTFTIVNSEHSKDSHWATTNLKIAGATLVYENTYRGARASRHPPVKKEFELSADDLARLTAWLKQKNLLRTKSIVKPVEPQSSAFALELSLETRLSGKQNIISISAPRSATELKNDSLYRDLVGLLNELYRIIHRKDPDIAVPSLID